MNDIWPEEMSPAIPVGFFFGITVGNPAQPGELYRKIGQLKKRKILVNGSMKEPNISIYLSFFHPSLNGVLFLTFRLLVEGECQISVLKYY